ncbi:MAG TPA: hypothetical protein VED43_16675 [Mycobacterium sp.]|nr:hypothetical protein [Mycobacterium sp.]
MTDGDRELIGTGEAGVGGVQIIAPSALCAMLPCAGLPNATGVTPLVAANSWPAGDGQSLPGRRAQFRVTRLRRLGGRHWGRRARRAGRHRD